MSTMRQVRDAFRSAVQIAYGVPAAVIWGRSDDVICDPIVRLSLVSDVEETPIREDHEADGADIAVGMSQMRRLTFQVLLETENDGAVAASALDTLPRVRMGLWSQAARAPIYAVGAAIIRAFPDIRPHHYRVDGRWIHAWSFDVTIRAVLDLADPTPLGTITSVTIGQTVDGANIGDIIVNG